jgi:hypothetical protein
MTPKRGEKTFEYDACLSFAGEDRAYVRRVAAILAERGIRVFYDEYAEVELWGKDLYVHLDQVYGEAARFCILFASKNYARKLWTNHERQSAQARAFREHKEYILPVRFDETKIPGLRDTVGFLDASKKKPEQLAALIAKKIGARQRSNYFPPVPDRLFKDLRARSKKAREGIYSCARSFIQALERMSENEREIVFGIFSNSCPAELPDNVHINIDLLRRLTNVAPARIKRELGRLSSLGFSSSLREDDENEESLGRREMLVLKWSDFSADVDEPEEATAVADAMIRLARERYCSKCGDAALRRLDFGQLATVTVEDDIHSKSS